MVDHGGTTVERMKLGDVSEWRRGWVRDGDVAVARVVMGRHKMAKILPRSMILSHGPISMAPIDHLGAS